MVVVLTTATAAVEILPIRRPHLIDLARAHQQLQCAVDSRQPDRDPAATKLGMKLLGAPELPSLGQQGEHFAALPGTARHTRRSPAHQISLSLASRPPEQPAADLANGHDTASVWR